MNTLLVGFRTLKDVLEQRVSNDLIDKVNTAYEKTIAEHQRMVDLMLALFVFKTTQFKLKFKSPVNARLQPLDGEFGRAKAVRMFGQYELGLPLQSAGIATGLTRKARIKQTVQDANDTLALLLDADRAWLRDHILAALFANASYTFGDEEHGDLVVQPLANGDSVKYWIRAGAAAGETANHFIAQAAAISDAANPIQTAVDKLKRRPENSGRRIVMVASNLTASIKNLADFIDKDDPDITRGANTDRLTGAGPTNVVGELIGKTSGAWIVEWESLPSGYFFGLSEGGPKPIAMRQEPEAELQGFTAVGDRVDIPYFERQFDRHAGFGAYNRVGAVVGLVGSGAYAVPAGYETPMI